MLVCAHGKRDQCCAVLGRPIAARLSTEFGDTVWECSHTGGHRFAPSMILLPTGYTYGRLSAEQSAEAARRRPGRGVRAGTTGTKLLGRAGPGGRTRGPGTGDRGPERAGGGRGVGGHPHRRTPVVRRYGGAGTRAQAAQLRSRTETGSSRRRHRGTPAGLTECAHQWAPGTSLPTLRAARPHGVDLCARASSVRGGSGVLSVTLCPLAAGESGNMRYI